ncbi:MAG: hypothetical protein OXG15_00890 [Gammaproteobacteria bacterium]|nr:hypothetical protein [Gammaproteobacteria bacterium]
MTGYDLPERDQIVRYIKPRMIKQNGNADGSSFTLRTDMQNETGLPVNWLEVLGSDRSNQLSEVRRLSRLELRRNGRFAELNVGEVIRRVAHELDTLRIMHVPLTESEGFPADSSHALISGLPPGESDHALLVGDLIARCVVSMHPAKD